VAGTLGNHDYDAGDRGAYELDLLGMPSRYYTRRVGNVQLFLLDSNEVSDAQTSWLEQRLKGSKARWKVAVFHHPPYNCGRHSPNEAVQAEWVPLFERYGVDLVLSGHDHNYQRFSAKNGVTYVIHGGGGAGLYDIESCPSSHPPLAFAVSAHGFLSVVAKNVRLWVTAIGLDGRRVDRVKLAP
jgi:3',5'-cyclic AMP phosphodiesterase CpdA